MEVVTGDLRQVIHDGISEKDLNNFIENVFDSNWILAKSGIKHNDLHIGNVFIKNINNDEYAVLGDFGKSIQSKYTFLVA